MSICVIYSSPKLGDIILQLPFLKAISEKYKQKITICINKHVSIKHILEGQDYIDCVVESSFRKGIFFLYDILKLSLNLKQKKIKIAFILEKTKGPAIALNIAGVKKIYGFGIGTQKFFVDQSIKLNKNDLRYNYSFQSEKFLKQFDIFPKYNDKFLFLNLKINDFFF